jgi:hypothetical protein
MVSDTQFLQVSEAQFSVVPEIQFSQVSETKFSMVAETNHFHKCLKHTVFNGVRPLITPSSTIGKQNYEYTLVKSEDM